MSKPWCLEKQWNRTAFQVHHLIEQPGGGSWGAASRATSTELAGQACWPPLIWKPLRLKGCCSTAGRRVRGAPCHPPSHKCIVGIVRLECSATRRLSGCWHPLWQPERGIIGYGKRGLFKSPWTEIWEANRTFLVWRRPCPPHSALVSTVAALPAVYVNHSA